MAKPITFNELGEFGSDDDEEEDEDYEISQVLTSEEDGEEKSCCSSSSSRRRRRRKKTCAAKASIQATVRKSKVENLFAEMNRFTEINRPKVVANPADNFMLQFHKRYSNLHVKKNATTDEVKNHLDIAVARIVADGSERFDIREFKRKCREHGNSNNTRESADLVKNALGKVRESGGVKVEKTIRYAGKTFSIEQTMDRNSGQYQHYLRTKQAEERKKAGGQFAVLDQLLQKYDQPTAINSIQKSEADWIKYKETTGMKDQLQDTTKDGFLERKAFLNTVELRQHEKEVELKRRRIVVSSPPAPQ